MAVMVVFIHMSRGHHVLSEADYSFLSHEGIINILSALFSQILPSIAVPAFFLISGFLFFRDIDSWDPAKFAGKLRSRAKTLLLPFVLWILIGAVTSSCYYFALYFFRDVPLSEYSDFFRHLTHCFTDYDLGEVRTSWLGFQSQVGFPIIVPLWFLRDLIVVTLFTPLIFFGIKRLGIWMPLILFTSWFTMLWIYIPGFHATAFFFYTLGAYISLNRLNIIELAERFRRPLICVAVIAIPLALYYTGTPACTFFQPLYTLSGVFLAFLIAGRLISRNGIRPLNTLTSACFFIYAFHTLILPYPLDTLTWKVPKLLAPVAAIHPALDILCYFIAPFITVAICVALYHLLRRIAPRLTATLCGGR